MKICHYIFLSMILVEKSAVQLLLFFVCEKKKNYMQWFHVKTFEFVCYCFYWLTSILLLFCLQDKFWCFYHFLWVFWLKKKCTFHGNIYINEKLNSFSNKKCNFYVKKKKKKYFNWLQEVIFPQFFSCFECKYVLIALVYGKTK